MPPCIMPPCIILYIMAMQAGGMACMVTRHCSDILRIIICIMPAPLGEAELDEPPGFWAAAGGAAGVGATPPEVGA